MPPRGYQLRLRSASLEANFRLSKSTSFLHCPGPARPSSRLQVGAFPHYGRWSEWNGHFRDTVRQFVKGTEGPWVGNLASVLCGSPHIYVAEPGEQDW